MVLDLRTRPTSSRRMNCARNLTVGVCTRRIVFHLRRYVAISWWSIKTIRRIRLLCVPIYKTSITRMLWSEDGQLYRWTTTTTLTRWTISMQPRLLPPRIHQPRIKSGTSQRLLISVQMSLRGRPRIIFWQSRRAHLTFQITSDSKRSRNGTMLTLIKIWRLECSGIASSSKRIRCNIWFQRLIALRITSQYTDM